jgi:hypothetical protein
MDLIAKTALLVASGCPTKHMDTVNARLNCLAIGGMSPAELANRVREEVVKVITEEREGDRD